MFKKSLSEGQAGDNVGLLLRRIQRDDVVRGQVVCKPGSVTPHQKFKGEIYALTKEEGGRHTPFFTNYKPQFFFRTADITGNALPLSLLTIMTRFPAVYCAGTVPLLMQLHLCVEAHLCSSPQAYKTGGVVCLIGCMSDTILSP